MDRRRIMERIPGLSFWALCYTYAGLILFLLEWVKPLHSIPLIGLLLVALFQFYKIQRLGKTCYNGPDQPTNQWPVAILLATILLLYLVLQGNGGIYRQPADWDKHNRILSDLIFEGWPVYYHNSDSNSMLTYYIGQYLVPAAVGKVFHSFRAGELAMLFWNFLGTYLSVLLFFRITKANSLRKQSFALLVFLFSGTVLFLSRGLYAATAVGVTDVTEAWLSKTVYLQYRHVQTVLRWIPTIGPPAWIAAALFVEELDSPKHYLLIATPLLLSASLPFVGIALLMIGAFVVKMMLPDTSGAEQWSLIKDCVSVPNLCALPILSAEAIYLFGNVVSEKPAELGLTLINFGANTTLYFCFCIGFACYSIILFPILKQEPLFYVVNFLLFLFPLFSMGLHNDLCMGASVPVIFLLISFVVRGMFLYTEKGKEQFGRAIILGLLVFWGSIYPIRETLEQIRTGPMWDGSARYTLQREVGSMNVFARRDGTIKADLAYNYYTYDYESSPFYLWLAKDK